VPEPPAIDVGTVLQERLVELAMIVRVTVPAKPLIGATAMVEVPPEPALTMRFVMVAFTLKSWIVKVKVALCDRLVLVLVTLAR
jgi:hypothetical protein